MMFYFPSDCLKIGYSVSKKHGKAVKRNRIKRLLRARTREIFKDCDYKYNIVFLPKVKENYSYNEYLEDTLHLRKQFEKDILSGKSESEPKKNNYFKKKKWLFLFFDTISLV